MAINDFLKRDINRLVVPEKSKQGLPPRQEAAIFTAKRGSGKSIVRESVVAKVTRKEVITVYSHLVITEDGAFEPPLNWPNNNLYPAGTPVPNPLPPTLIYQGGVLSMDPSVAYYLQRRVHLVVFEVDSNLQEDHLFVPFAEPFKDTGYAQGLDLYTEGYSPKMYMVWANLSNGPTTARWEEFKALNIGLEP